MPTQPLSQLTDSPATQPAFPPRGYDVPPPLGKSMLEQRAAEIRAERAAERAEEERDSYAEHRD